MREPPARPRDSAGRDHPRPPSPVALFLSRILPRGMDRAPLDSCIHPSSFRPPSPSRLPAFAVNPRQRAGTNPGPCLICSLLRPVTV
jgi:hypothetical protein